MKPTILYAWEIGDGYGHLQNLVAHASRRRHAEARFAIPETAALHGLPYLERHGFTNVTLLRNAPPIDWSRYSRVKQPWRARDFGDVLAAYGFDTVSRLDHLVDQAARAMVDADELVTDTAPTFNLIGLGARDVGSTWSMPPAGRPMTPFPGADESQAPIVPERTLLDVIRCAAGDRGEFLSSAVTATHQIPSSYPELDVYGLDRGVGPARRFSPMAPPSEPARFAYLDRGYPALAGVLGALAESSTPVRAHVKGDTTRGRFGSLTLIGEFDLGEELLRANEVIHHGSSGLANSAFGARRKQGCLPWHVENLAHSHTLCRAAGAWMLGYDDIEQLRTYLRAAV